MANDLTGDFDFVAEFAVGAVNRMLAAMHACERFPHSISAHIDDTETSVTGVVNPVLVGAVDNFGFATVSQYQIGKPVPISGKWDVVVASLGTVVNGIDGFAQPPVVPSNFSGNVQLQLSPPWIDLAGQEGTNLTVRIETRSRYFPDLQTPPLAQFIRGELALTAALNQVASQAGNVIEVDLQANSVGISFTPENVSLSADDVAGINQFIRNALKTSFLPSNAPLPSNIQFLQFNVFSQAPGAIAVLLNVNTPRGNPATVTQMFLGSADDFGFAVGRDFIVAAFQPVVNSILSSPIPDFTISIDLLFDTIHITYSMTLHSVTLDLQFEKLVLTIQGHAHTGSSIAPDFDFTVTQNFGLRVDGATANLMVEDISVDTSSWVADLFKSQALPSIEQARDQALNQSNAQPMVRQMFNVNTNLGGFLQSLVNAPIPGSTPPPVSLQLSYTSIHIQPAGIVLHGLLGVSWPAPHVEFEQSAPVPRGPGGVVFTSPEYSALNTWIPGGTIQQFEWSYGPSAPFVTDPDKFVLFPPPPVTTNAPFFVQGYAPLCLTVVGTRPPAIGAGPPEPVSGEVCAYTLQTLLNGTTTTVDSAPMVALAQAGPNGLVQVTGQAPAQVDKTGKNTSNVIVHFADVTSITHLDALTEALQLCGRNDAAAAIVAVVPAADLPKTLFRSGIIYTEDQGGVWEKIFGVSAAKRPLTILVNPGGAVIWQQEGTLDAITLSGLLRKLLVRSRPPSPNVARLDIQLGRLAPDFLFEYAPKKYLRLSKLGRAARLVFYRSTVPASLGAVQTAGKPADPAVANAPVLLAIADGESADRMKRVAAESGLPGFLVPDPHRDISAAYGVHLWPTIVSVDQLGLVQAVRYGWS